MTGPGLPAPGTIAAENELLARLGLPKSASPEDVDDLHQAASQFLASAPPELRGWAHAQASALDEAYLQLTDPVGLQGSALRSPARPPAVVPGGPATPPARRGSVPAATPIPAAATASAGVEADLTADDANLDDLAVLYASVTPSAHPDMLPAARPKAKAPVARPARSAVVRRTSAPATRADPQAANPWKRLVLAGVAVIAIAGVGFGAMQVIGAIGGGSPTPGAVAQATPTPAVLDSAKVAQLMAKLQANPKDVDTLLALANEYYGVEQYQQAGGFLDQALAIDPKNVLVLLARGTVSFNLRDTASAEKTWRQVLEIDPNNVDAHYDLGFMYFYQATPDYPAVVREWTRVIELDPTSTLAQTAKAHLDALVAKSMIPAIPPSASPAASTGASPSGASASPAPSTAPTVAPSAPAASPTASPTP